MNNLPKAIVLIFLASFAFGVFANRASAAKLYLSPESGSFTSSFSADVMLDPETDKIDAVDVVLTYDTTKLDVLEITSGSFEQYLKKSFNRAVGKIEISALNATSPADKVTKVAKITFSPLSSAVTKVDFVYSPGAVDDTNALEKGIESLTAVAGGIYTLSMGSAGVGATEPPTPSVSVGSSTPEVPQTGAVPNTLYLYIVLSLAVTTAGLVLLKTS